MEKKTFLQAYGLLSAGQRKQGLGVIFLLIFQSILDFFSLASFLPLIFMIISPGQIETNPYLSKIYQLSPTNEPLHFGLAMTFITITLIAVKVRANAWISFRKATFAYSVSNDLASKALSKYFSIPYTAFTATDYTKEMNRISNYPLIFANNFIIPIGTILSEALMLAILLVAISIYNPMVSGFIVVIILTTGLLVKVQQKKTGALSLNFKQLYPKLLKRTLQAVEALTEIRTLQKEYFFQKRFDEAYQHLGNAFARDHIANTRASRVTELVAACCIGALIVYALLSQQSSDATVMLLSVFAGVSLRAIPSINRIFAAMMQIRRHDYVVQELVDLVMAAPHVFKDSAEPLVFNKGLELRNISFRFEDQPWLLKDASLYISKGERILFTGKSGSGKTTFFLMLLRYLNQHNGEILVDGNKVSDEMDLAYRKLMGYVPQNPYILDGSITENIAFGVTAEEVDSKKIDRLVSDLDLSVWISALPEGLSTVLGEKGTKISGGQRQRLAIARALYHQAEILLLDEVTNQLDKETELEVVRAVKNLSPQKKTIILITHRPELWRFFDSFYELKEGHIIRTDPVPTV